MYPKLGPPKPRTGKKKFFLSVGQIWVRYSTERYRYEKKLELIIFDDLSGLKFPEYRLYWVVVGEKPKVAGNQTYRPPDPGVACSIYRLMGDFIK